MDHLTFSPNETMVGTKTRMSAREEEKKRWGVVWKRKEWEGTVEGYGNIRAW